ncbi:uncharacterized protein LOC118187929 [Stegodyphus dumicola]|uniref:uncharacterized protein LOC118187929 n=1 Tax=Stegodyphus dumicola TaxID=202533 RepID=UPI0015A87C79|nr:uncharacterized protein LOC118187929 [Stegodyphus dumicola]
MMTQRNGINIPKYFMDIFTPYVMNLLEARLTDTYEIYEFSAQYFERKIKERQSKSPRSRPVAEEVKCVSRDARREFKKESRKKISESDISSNKGPLDILPDLEYDSAIEFHPMSYQGQCSNNFQKFQFDKELSSDDKHFISKSSAPQGLSTPTSISKVLQHLRHIPEYIAALVQLIEELPEDTFTQDAINNFMHCGCFI